MAAVTRGFAWELHASSLLIAAVPSHCVPLLAALQVLRRAGKIGGESLFPFLKACTMANAQCNGGSQICHQTLA